jgi:3D (Asp-Asp-Asp) domain-containing protein
VATTKDLTNRAGARRALKRGGLWAAAAVATVVSAIAAKEMSLRQPPAAVAMVSIADPSGPRPLIAAPEDVITDEPGDDVSLVEEGSVASPDGSAAADPHAQWFNGRPIRPARKMWMVVTGYSPDARSCGDSADGKTATLHSVHTNRGRLIAADTRLLPYGSMVSVPGYDDGKVAPVLDCGGAIKGHRLDLLFPTHEQALKWGKKRVQVTVWEYADGRPAENPRKVR